MVTTGFSACIGSWKMHAISEPRTDCKSLSGSVARSRPSNKISPFTIFALGHGNKRKMLIAVTLFPQPDSPTNAKNSPGKMSNETRSVTCNGDLPSRELPFLSNPNATETSFTRKTGTLLDPSTEFIPDSVPGLRITRSSRLSSLVSRLNISIPRLRIG